MQWVMAITHCAGGAGLGGTPLPAGRDVRDAPKAPAEKGRHHLMLVQLLLPVSAPHLAAYARSSFLVAWKEFCDCSLMYTSHSSTSTTPLPSVSISLSCMRSTACVMNALQLGDVAPAVWRHRGL